MTDKIIRNTGRQRIKGGFVWLSLVILGAAVCFLWFRPRGKPASDNPTLSARSLASTPGPAALPKSGSSGKTILLAPPGSYHPPEAGNEAEFARSFKRAGIDSETSARALELYRTLEAQMGSLERLHSKRRRLGVRTEVEVPAFPNEAKPLIDEYVANMGKLLGPKLSDELLFGDNFERTMMHGGLFEKFIVVTERWEGNQLTGYEFLVETYVPTKASHQRKSSVRGTVKDLHELSRVDPALKAHFRAASP